MERTRLQTFASVFFGVARSGTVGSMHADGRDAIDLPATGIGHPRADIKRIHAQLLIQGLHCLDHIKDDFPSFFSFQLRVIASSISRTPRRANPGGARRLPHTAIDRRQGLGS